MLRSVKLSICGVRMSWGWLRSSIAAETGAVMQPEDTQLKLIAALTEVRNRLDAGEDSWRFSLLRTFREYARAIGVERRLLDPIQKMMNETAEEIEQKRRTEQGKKGRPSLNRAMPMTVVAAAVTILKQRGDYASIGEAEAAVARASGIDRTEIKHFRDNVSRRKVSKSVAEFIQKLSRSVQNLVER